MSQIHRWKSDFAQDVSEERIKLLDSLISQLTDAQPGEPRHEATVKVALAATEYHQYLDTDPKVVEAQFASIKDRLDQNAQFDKAEALALLQAQLLNDSFNESTQRDFGHRILSLLADLARRVLDTRLEPSDVLTAVLGKEIPVTPEPPTYFSEDDDSGAEQTPVYSPGDDLSDWSDAEIEPPANKPPLGDPSHTSGEGSIHGGGAPSTPEQFHPHTAPVETPQPPPKLQQPREVYEHTSLAVWLAKRQDNGLPAHQVLEPSLCFTEQQLIQQVLNILKGLGTPGPAFRLDPITRIYTVQPGVHMSSVHSTTLFSLLQWFADLGTALRHVQQFCDAMSGRSKDWPVRTDSREAQEVQKHIKELRALPTVAAFSAAVASQLHEIRHSVLGIDMQATAALFERNAHASNDGDDGDNNNTSSREQGMYGGAEQQPLLTLLSLQSPASLLQQQAAALCEVIGWCVWRGSPAKTVAGLFDGLDIALDKYMMQATSQGSAKVAAMLLQVFTSGILPYLDVLQMWLYHGVVDDPANEFFIVRNETVAENSLAFWTHGFKLRSLTASKVPAPAFLARYANEILAGGACALALKRSAHHHNITVTAGNHHMPPSNTSTTSTNIGGGGPSSQFNIINDNDSTTVYSTIDDSEFTLNADPEEVSMHTMLVTNLAQLLNPTRRIAGDAGLLGVFMTPLRSATPSATTSRCASRNLDGFEDQLHVDLESWMAATAFQDGSLPLALPADELFGPLQSMTTSISQLQSEMGGGLDALLGGTKAHRSLKTLIGTLAVHGGGHYPHESSLSEFDNQPPPMITLPANIGGVKTPATPALIRRRSSNASSYLRGEYHSQGLGLAPTEEEEGDGREDAPPELTFENSAWDEWFTRVENELESVPVADPDDPRMGPLLPVVPGHETALTPTKMRRDRLYSPANEDLKPQLPYDWEAQWGLKPAGYLEMQRLIDEKEVTPRPTAIDCENAFPWKVLLQQALLEPIVDKVEESTGQLHETMLAAGLPEQLSTLQDLFLLNSPALEQFVRSLLTRISTPRGIDGVLPFEITAAFQDALAREDDVDSALLAAAVESVTAEVIPLDFIKSNTTSSSGSNTGVACLSRLRFVVQPRWPLSVVATEDMLTILGQVCTLMLQLRWAIESLHAARAAGWQRRKRGALHDQSSSAVLIYGEAFQRGMDALQREMLQFTQGVLQHVVLQVMAAGNRLEKELNKCSALDTMQEAVAEYLNYVARWSLVGSDSLSTMFMEGLPRLLDGCLYYCSLHMQLRKVASAINEAQENEEDVSETLQASHEKLQSDLQGLRKEWVARRNLVMQMLLSKASGAGGQAEVAKSLLAVLDIGSYFDI